MVIPWAIGLIVCGLVMAWLHTAVTGVLSTVVYWAGVILVIFGLVLLLAPVLIWVRNQLVAAFGL